MPEIVVRPLLGDCREVLKTLPDDSIDLIVTSPPYADQRKNTYGVVHPDDYVEWFRLVIGPRSACKIRAPRSNAEMKASTISALRRRPDL
jgi:adenine-specific DNA methylase